jgi:hypothetical protein
MEKDKAFLLFSYIDNPGNGLWPKGPSSFELGTKQKITRIKGPKATADQISHTQKDPESESAFADSFSSPSLSSSSFLTSSSPSSPEPPSPDFLRGDALAVSHPPNPPDITGTKPALLKLSTKFFKPCYEKSAGYSNEREGKLTRADKGS